MLRDGPYLPAEERRGSSTRFTLFSRGRRFDVDVDFEDGTLKVSFGGKQFEVQLTRAQGGDAIFARLDKGELRVTIDDETESTLKLTVDGRRITLSRAQVPLPGGVPEDVKSTPLVTESEALLSPMFGKVISVEVEVGDSVSPGQPLVVMEAMKMESILHAAGKYKIKEILVKEGEGVDKGQALIRFA